MTHSERNVCDGNLRKDSVEQPCEQVNRKYESGNLNQNNESRNYYDQRNFRNFGPRVYERQRNNYEQQDYRAQRWQPSRNACGGYDRQNNFDRRVNGNQPNVYHARREVNVSNVQRGKRRNGKWFNREKLRNLSNEEANVPVKGQRAY